MSFCVIHLSDIHLCTEDDIILSRSKCLAKACSSVIPTDANVVIAISGDIAFSGLESQYSFAKRLISEIIEYLKKEKNADIDVLLVPGNHDCDFSSGNQSVREALLKSVTPDIDEEYYSLISNVQNNYYDFASNYGIDTSDCVSTKAIQTMNGEVLFVLVNTSWMSVLKEKMDTIIIPNRNHKLISSNDYKAVFFLLHHPTNWLKSDYKDDFVNYVRKNADVVLVGHEHIKDQYQKEGEKYSVLCNHGKELQNTKDEHSSAFSILRFDDDFQNYTVYEFSWDRNKYSRIDERRVQYHKNFASQFTVFNYNKNTQKFLNDVGIVINHFAKEHVLLQDLYVWPYLKRINYNEESSNSIQIYNNIDEEILGNKLSIITGSSCGKTTFAKMLCLNASKKERCCLYVDGKKLTSSSIYNIEKELETVFCDEYSKDCLEEFRQLEKKNKIVIVDNFDSIKTNNNRRSIIIDYLINNFNNVVIMMETSLEITSILSSNYIGKLEDLFYYEILPFGNKKRKELISKWYYLGNEIYSQEEIERKIDDSATFITSLLGNATTFMPALPVFILGVLQSNDAKTQTYERTKYAVLYESFIFASLSKVSQNFATSASCNIACGVMSFLSFRLLTEKKLTFTKGEFNETIKEIETQKRLDLSSEDILNKMIQAQIVCEDSYEREVYHFKYPYIFYYFAGRYISQNLLLDQVQEQLEYMSSRLFNEIYGNIIVFVCYLSKNKDVINHILLNAYGTLENYEAFDFSKHNPIFNEIHEAVDALIPHYICDNDEVESNNDIALERKDEIGVNDGQVADVKPEIDDELSDDEREREMASVIAAFKTLEVLGQILQNYPADIDGNDKIGIIDEIHKLGMRSVSALISAIQYVEKDLVDYFVERARTKGQNISRDEIVMAIKKFVQYLISGTVIGMLHQVAISLNSPYLLNTAEYVFNEDGSISSKLVLVDLKLNCLKKLNTREVIQLKELFDDNNERFASSILTSIVGRYLNYNRCDNATRSKLCIAFGLSRKQTLLESKKNDLNN